MRPFELDPDRDTICDAIRRWAEIQPDAPALYAPEGDGVLTYGRLLAAMDGIRAALDERGLGRGDRVAVVHSGDIDMATLMLGVLG
ncbi:MAG TPA: AMP-binding protein, partial [Alphaproteobacteria bacterium]